MITTLTSTVPAGQSLECYGLGAYFNTNGTPGSSFHFTGDMAEVIIYNRALTSTEDTQVKNYLTGKYLTVNYTVTPSAGANGTISPSTAQTVSSGNNVTFNALPARPATRWRVGRWTAPSCRPAAPAIHCRT